MGESEVCESASAVQPLSQQSHAVDRCASFRSLCQCALLLALLSLSFSFSQVVTVYNFIMSGASAVLFGALAMELWASYRRAGFLDLFCDPWIRNSRGAMIFFYYINYIFKYIELVDTAFLCLRAKQTPFIHVVRKGFKGQRHSRRGRHRCVVIFSSLSYLCLAPSPWVLLFIYQYHHAITLCLCWTQLTSSTCMQWVIIVINLGVHVLLYAYYGLYEMKANICAGSGLVGNGPAGAAESEPEPPHSGKQHLLSSADSCVPAGEFDLRYISADGAVQKRRARRRF